MSPFKSPFSVAPVPCLTGAEGPPILGGDEGLCVTLWHPALYIWPPFPFPANILKRAPACLLLLISAALLLSSPLSKMLQGTREPSATRRKGLPQPRLLRLPCDKARLFAASQALSLLRQHPWLVFLPLRPSLWTLFLCSLSRALPATIRPSFSPLDISLGASLPLASWSRTSSGHRTLLIRVCCPSSAFPSLQPFGSSAVLPWPVPQSLSSF